MYNEESPLDPRLERELDAMRAEELSPEEVEAVSARAWTRIRTGHVALSGCAAFQELFPDYRAGTLSEAKRLLVEDHTHECVACRKALHAEGETQKVLEFKPRRRWWSLAPVRWAAAAAVVFGVGLTTYTLLNRAAGSEVVLASAEGSVLQVAGGEIRPVAIGAMLAGGTEVRTAKGSWAMARLEDGSQVEMGERTALHVSASGGSLTVHLDQGNVIVQAAKRSSGNLFVATRDCRVAVTGTVFSVNSGVKGSRVMVVEGEVHVSKAGEKQILHGGDQYASDPSMRPVSAEQELGWSRNLDRHIAAMKELQALEKSLREIRSPELRYASRLLERLPARTGVVVSLPNPGDAVTQLEQVLKQRAVESEAVRKALENGMVKKFLDQVRTVSGHLGEEIVLFAPLDEKGRPADLMIMAEAKREGLADHISGQLNARVSMLPGNVAVISHNPKSDTLIAAGGFAGTALYARMQEVYRRGAGIVAGVNAQAFCQSNPKGCTGELARLEAVIFEQQEPTGKSGLRVSMAFDGPRQGVASWLGAPSALRVMDFVSQDTSMMATFSVINAVAALEEMLAKYPEAQKAVDEVEAKTGVKVREDLAASLGGEILVAMDGPALPAPSWKLVAEVYDPVKLQWAIERFVQAFNRESGKSAEVIKETLNGRLYYVIRVNDSTVVEAHYTYVDGYLVAAANRNLIEQAMKLREAGLTLARSQKFQELLPKDEQAGYSAMLYQNLAPSLGPLVEEFGGAVKPEQKEAIKGLTGDLKPMLVAGWTAADKMTFNSSSGLLQFGLNNMGVMNMLGSKPKGTRAPKRAYR